MDEMQMAVWAKEWLGDIPPDEPMEAFQRMQAHAVSMSVMGLSDPVTTVTAGFVIGFEVYRRFFNGSGS